ncbi:MAG: hypothetical protein KAH56_05320 [Candidatus Krumholzibacteria bacterium]|nr:hypothetical protein [Candidatus Krumholzibacteria bacterium]
MAKKGFRQVSVITAAIGLLLLLGSGLAEAAEIHRLGNGITATVYSPAEISEQWITLEKDSAYLTHPAAGTVELDVGSDVMYPFDQVGVVEALAAMRGFETSVDVDVFILPATPARVGSSFARRNAIYLAPGISPVEPSTAAYITTHEMGHLLTWAFIDGQSARWKAYMDIRGLDASSFDPNVIHADRAREILAEDIRALFGGTLATVSGSIENHNLIHPGRVDGLKEMLAEFFLGRDVTPLRITSSAFPNPCNPRTTIEMALPEGMGMEGRTGILRIFDIRGALVQTLTGGHVANNALTIQWDGTGRSGAVVSSGRYLYVLEMGQLMSKGTVTLVR